MVWVKRTSVDRMLVVEALACRVNLNKLVTHDDGGDGCVVLLLFLGHELGYLFARQRVYTKACERVDRDVCRV